MNRIPMFPAADPAQVAATAQRIGEALVPAAAMVCSPMITDETIHPAELSAAIVETHLLGAAAAIAAAADNGLTSTADRAELARMVGERLERLMAACDRTKN